MIPSYFTGSHLKAALEDTNYFPKDEALCDHSGRVNNHCLELLFVARVEARRTKWCYEKVNFQLIWMVHLLELNKLGMMKVFIM